MTAFASVDSMEDLKIKFNGDAHQIDANTLINSLIHFSNIAQEINKELSSDRKLEIKINALSEGSFLVHLVFQSSLMNVLGDLFTKENVKLAGEICSAIGGVYALAKKFKGKKAEIGKGNITITNNTGSSITVNQMTINLYNDNGVVRGAISKEFETLEKDENIEGFELLNKDDESIINIERSEFADLADISKNEETPEEREITKTGILSISTLSFERNVKWSFVYEGNKIAAKINDEAFVTLIDAGKESFAKGDALEAELAIKQSFDKSVNAYLNDSFRIIKIIRHIPRSEQGKLGL